MDVEEVSKIGPQHHEVAVSQIDDAYYSQDEGHGEGNHCVKASSLETFDEHMGLPESENSGQDYTDDSNLIVALFQLTRQAHQNCGVYSSSPHQKTIGGGQLAPDGEVSN